MAHRQVIATQTGRYGTRMLTAGDELTLSGPAARAMIALGRAREVSGPSYVPVDPRRASIDDTHMPNPLTALRAEYQEKFGKRPFNGWDAATLREKIAAA